MKKHNWVGYNRNIDVLEVTLKDSSNAKVETWRVAASDKKRLKQLAKILRNKYNIELNLGKEATDLDWLP